MADFSKNIQDFTRYGTYEYKFDSVGNLIFNSASADFSQVYVSIPLVNIVYNDSKVESFYNPTFTEFVPVSPVPQTEAVISGLQSQVDNVQRENDELKSKLDDLISQTPAQSTTIDPLATKQVILELRKLIGQGRVDSDFSDTFPYTAIRKTTE